MPRKRKYNNDPAKLPPIISDHEVVPAGPPGKATASLERLRTELEAIQVQRPRKRVAARRVLNSLNQSSLRKVALALIATEQLADLNV